MRLRNVNGPTVVYLVECDYDSEIVIFGLTCNLTTRRHERGYGEILHVAECENRSEAERIEAAVLEATKAHAVGAEHRGRTTWTEARRMPKDAAIALLQSLAIAKI